jgi:hypothetical protein
MPRLVIRCISVPATPTAMSRHLHISDQSARRAIKPGHGSKPREHRGGRKKGTRNKRMLAQIAAAGGQITPLDHLLAVIRDETEDIDRRLACTIAAAPHCHPKLKAIEASRQGGEPIETKVVLTFD